MVLDSSALVAVVLREPDWEKLLETMIESEPLGIGAPTLVEVLLVLSRKLHGEPRAELVGLLRALEAEVVPFTEEHCHVALRAHLRYGKGHHPAALNFGDCMAYAIAKVADEPLLFVGEDFGKTDITPGRAPSER